MTVIRGGTYNRSSTDDLDGSFQELRLTACQYAASASFVDVRMQCPCDLPLSPYRLHGLQLPTWGRVDIACGPDQPIGRAGASPEEKSKDGRKRDNSSPLTEITHHPPHPEIGISATSNSCPFRSGMVSIGGGFLSLFFFFLLS